MGLFGSKDKTQDQSISQLSKTLDQVVKNQNVIIQNQNKYVIPWIEYLSKQSKQVAGTLNALITKDQAHDQKDAEHDTLIQSIKSMAKAVEQTAAGEVTTTE